MLSIYGRVPQLWGAIHFYRFLQPVTFMQKAGLAQPFPDYGDTAITDDERLAGMAFSDIHWAYQDNTPQFQKFLEMSIANGPFWRTLEDWQPPVNMVIDTDDDLFNVSPNNIPAFQRLGTRYKGQELERGFTITADRLNGEKVTLWEDGKNINVMENRRKADQYRHNLAIASLVTCATPGAEAAIKREVPSAQTFVMPNCIDLDDYPAIELADHSPTVRVLWQGGDSHLEDMFFIREALGRVLRAHPHVELVIWGAKYIWPEWPQDQVRHVKWSPYQEYKLRLNSMNHDINLAPLVPNIFNEAKSSIKVYESAACYRPAPSLAQKTGPYTEFTDGETAMLFETEEEFEAKLTALIEDATLRKTIASNCKDWIAINRDPMKWAIQLAEQFEALRKGRRAVTTPPRRPEESNVQPVPAFHA